MVRAVVSFAKSDEVSARRLCRALRAVRVPAALAGELSVPRRVSAIGMLATGPKVDEKERSALVMANCLYVIASPAATRAAGVAETIDIFRAANREAPVIALIVSGVANAVAQGHDRDRESLPSSLLVDDGRVTLINAGKNRRTWRRSVLKALAAGLGIASDRLLNAMHARSTRRQFWGGIAAASVLLVAALGLVVVRDARAIAALGAAETRAGEAQAALNIGDVPAALRTLERALRYSDDMGNPADISPAVRAALTRVTLDTRLLADVPAPTTTANVMRILPTGVLAMTETGGRTHLVDLATGEATTVYDPDRFTYTRISADGGTLWTAHFGAEERDENGDIYAPLIFEEAELATGTVRLTTAVRSVPSYGGAAEISPDGALFAVDLGAGEGESTVIGVFHREAQALAGVLTLPSDHADIRFVGPGHLLASIDRPGVGIARGPELYLWRIGDPRAKTLRTKGAPVSCGASSSDGSSSIGGRLALSIGKMRIDLSDDNREVALSSATADGAGCVRRWSLPDGMTLPALDLDDPASAVSHLQAGGPHIVRHPAADASYVAAASLGHPADQPMPLSGCRGEVSGIHRGAGLYDVILCSGPDGAVLHNGPRGGLAWKGRMHQGGVTAHRFDPAGRRLITLGADARLRIWDIGARGRLVDPALPQAKLTRTADGKLLAVGPTSVRLLDRNGGPVGSAVALTPAAEAVVALAGDSIGVVTRTDRTITFAIHDGGSTSEQPSATELYGGLGPIADATAVASANGLRFALVDRRGKALWGSGATGKILSRIDIGETRRVIAAYAGDQGYVLLGEARDKPDEAEQTFYIYAGGDKDAAGIISQKAGRRADVAMAPGAARALVRLETGLGDGVETRLILLDLATGAEVEVAKLPGHNLPFGFSGTGQYVYIGPHISEEKPVLIIADSATGRDIKQLEVNATDPVTPVWAADQDIVVVGGDDLALLDVQNGKALCEELMVPAANVALSPLGTRMAVRHQGRDGNDMLSVYDIEACALLTKRPADSAGATQFVGETRIWLSQPLGITAISLDVDLPSARQSVADRVKGLSIP